MADSAKSGFGLVLFRPRPCIRLPDKTKITKTAHFEIDHHSILLLNSKNESTSSASSFLKVVFKISAFCTDMIHYQPTSPVINSSVTNLLLQMFPDSYHLN